MKLRCAGEKRGSHSSADSDGVSPRWGEDDEANPDSPSLDASGRKTAAGFAQRREEFGVEKRMVLGNL